MFSVRFGAHLDGADCLRLPQRIADVDLGPNGFLQLLETHLGLGGIWPSTATRNVAYRDALQSALTQDRFYTASFAVDELGSSAELLRWRDALFLSGWDGGRHASFGLRLSALADVESFVASEVKCSTGERLQRVLAALERRRVPIESLTVVDPRASFPPAWRRVLDKLGARFEGAAPVAAGDSQLEKLQKGLLALVAGEPVDAIDGASDGSVQVVRAETRLMAGRWVAENLRQDPNSTVLLAEQHGEVLDHVLESAGLARNGFAAASAFRPSLQVLPLALALIWEPLDFHAALEFLSHSVCPLPRYARERLAEQMAERPGLHRASFSEVIGEIRQHYGERSEEIEASIDFWLFTQRYASVPGAPTRELTSRLQALRDFFVRRLGTSEPEAGVAFAAAYQQCEAVARALHQLESAGRTTISQVQLHKLVVQATSVGAPNPQRYAELGCTNFSDAAGAVIDPCERVLWWQFGKPASARPTPWTRAEVAALAAAGIDVESAAIRLDAETHANLRPILSARRQLILVLPADSEDIHPLWHLIKRVHPNIVVDELEPLLFQRAPAFGMAKVPHRPLPVRRRWWNLPAGVVPLSAGRFSFSTLNLYLNNPSQWVLERAARLQPSKLLAVADLFTLSGNVGHRVVERLFGRKDALTATDKELMQWVPGVIKEIVLSEAAIFLLPEYRARLRHLHDAVLRTVLELRRHVRDSGAVRVDVERELEGSFGGGELTGSADLVLAFETGGLAVVDMKWSGGKKYPDKLANNRHLQLVIYGGMLEQSTGKWPRYAYYLLEAARMLAHDKEVFAHAHAAVAAEPQTLPQLWRRFEKTWAWRHKQMKEGRIELVFDDIDADEDPPDGLLQIETLSPNYNPYVNLAGWAQGQ